MRITIKADPSKSRGKSYYWNLAEAMSQGLASVFGLNANLTFSAYCGYWQELNLPVRGKFYKFINLLFRDKKHCEDAWKNLT